MRILIIDDDPRHTEMLRRGLMLLGHDQIETAGSADAPGLLQSLRRGHYDLALVDLSEMRPQDSRLIGKIMRNNADLPIVVIRGLLSGPEVDVAKQNGHPILRKPFDADDLQRTIEAACSRDSYLPDRCSV